MTPRTTPRTIWFRSLLVTTTLCFACTHPSGEPPSTTQVAVPSDPGDDPGFPQPASCLQDSDCGEGGVCEGEGCGDDTPGTCVSPAARICTRDSAAFCGCDGETFRSSGSCPGKRYASRGECEGSGDTPPPSEGPQAAGAACLTAEDCLSGVCEGEGCGDDTPGVCADAKRPCTRDYRPYCGCDGTTFNSSGSCPGQRFSHRGAC